MTAEECARRMTALLARQPRHRKTRAYLETLPKRKKPVVVSPDEFCAPPPPSIAFVPAPLVRQVVARGQDGAEIARFVRKDRRRPKAAQQDPVRLSEANPPPPPLWACRDAHRYQEGRRGGEKAIRSSDATMRQRFLLYAAQEGLCGLCGQEMPGACFLYSLDHVIPRSLHGRDGLGNLVLCHGECNGQKTNDTPTGCEMVFLLAVNARLGVQPQVF